MRKRFEVIIVFGEDIFSVGQDKAENRRFEVRIVFGDDI